MAASSLALFGSAQTHPQKTKEEEEEDERSYQRHRDFAAGLPESKFGRSCLRRLSGFWLPESYVPGILAARERFVAISTDVVLASYPKCGTTWLKSLVFCVASRDGDRHPRSPRHPLLALNPHECVHFVEELYKWHKNPTLDFLQPPRLLATHLPLSLLPDSVKHTGCRLIYICRDPKDAFVSRWHFWEGMGGFQTGLTFDAVFEMLCTGVIPFGPMWEHVLEYWEEHRKRPDEVMFLTYEEVKREPAATVRRLAAFLGRPFSEEEERQGVVEDVASLCSLESLKRLNMDGFLEGDRAVRIEKKKYFRKGEIGDWVNHLTPEMAERLDGITQHKLQGSGLIL